MNNVSLIGRLGKPIELKYTGTGKAVCNFSIAVYESAEVTNWFDCYAFEKTAELLDKHTKKGDMIGVTGRLTKRKYTHKDGYEVHLTEIAVNHVTLTASAPKETDRYDTNRQTQVNKKPAPQEERPDFTEADYAGLQIKPDDLPF
jgi:single-strand DNA-binding protein